MSLSLYFQYYALLPSDPAIAGSSEHLVETEDPRMKDPEIFGAIVKLI